MKTNKTRMINTFIVLKGQHESIINSTSSVNTYSRMVRLFELYTVMCAEVAKDNEALARVYFQTGEFMIKEAYVSLQTNTIIHL